MLALARQIVSGEEDADAESVEQVFAQARDAEAASKEFLVDDGWKALESEREPVVVEVHADGPGPVGETVVVNGRLEEPTEGQQSLFSWAEFLAEEPALPRDGTANPSPLPRPCSSGR